MWGYPGTTTSGNPRMVLKAPIEPNSTIDSDWSALVDINSIPYQWLLRSYVVVSLLWIVTKHSRNLTPGLVRDITVVKTIYYNNEISMIFSPLVFHRTFFFCSAGFLAPLPMALGPGFKRGLGPRGFAGFVSGADVGF